MGKQYQIRLWKFRRLAADLRQLDVCLATGISQTRYSMIERGWLTRLNWSAAGSKRFCRPSPPSLLGQVMSVHSCILSRGGEAPGVAEIDRVYVSDCPTPGQKSATVHGDQDESSTEMMGDVRHSWLWLVSGPARKPPRPRPSQPSEDWQDHPWVTSLPLSASEVRP